MSKPKTYDEKLNCIRIPYSLLKQIKQKSVDDDKTIQDITVSLLNFALSNKN
jgi:hypothetical protein